MALHRSPLKARRSKPRDSLEDEPGFWSFLGEEAALSFLAVLSALIIFLTIGNITDNAVIGILAPIAIILLIASLFVGDIFRRS